MIEDAILPPHNIEAEQAVLGSMLLDEDACLDGLDLLRTDDFYREAHRLIFDAIRDMATKRIEIDSVTLKEELRQRNQLESVGGISYIAGLTNAVPTAANLRYYADIVAEKSRLRQIGTLCAEAARDAAGEHKASLDLLMEIQSRADGIRIFNQDRDPVLLMDLSMETIDRLEEQAKTPGKYTGLRTGLYDLDPLTGGFQRGDLIVLAGRPSMGKTALLQRFIQGVAEEEPDAGAIFWSSLEMSREQITLRWLCSVARVDLSHIRIGALTEEERDRIASAMARLSPLRVFIDDSPAQTVMEIRTKARRIKNKHGLALIGIDYLGLMGGDGKAERRDLEIGAITRGLKAMAKEFNCPVIALCQLNRAVEVRTSKIPTLADLRESGNIEQDADVVMFVYREEYYFPDKRPGEADLVIAKQRNGPCDTVALSFIKKYAAFESLAWKQSVGVSA